MPPRSVKMKRRILGFQRRVWWPKWTPASSSSRMETTDTLTILPRFGVSCRRGGWNRAERLGTATRVIRRVGCVNARILADPARTLRRVKGVVTQSAWDLAGEFVDEAIAEGATPAPERLGRLGQLGSLPSFIAALGHHEDLARLADDYPRER